VKPLQRPAIPIYFGGASGPALGVGARHCDVYALWGEPVAAIRRSIAEVRAAAPSGRVPRFSVSVRPILGATEEKAWARARSILARIVELRSGANAPAGPQNVGSQRLLELAARGEVHDKRLWTAIAAATGASGSTTALGGTAAQVAESLLDYYDAGANTVLIRGFDPLRDAIEFGRDLVPLIRAGVARRERQVVGAGAPGVWLRATRGRQKRGRVWQREPYRCSGEEHHDPGEAARSRRAERPERREIAGFLHADPRPEGGPRKPGTRRRVPQLRQGAPRSGPVPAGDRRAAGEDSARAASRRLAPR